VDRRFRCATNSTRRDLKRLEDVAHDFLSGAWAIYAACFWVPRPIAGGVSHPTNVAWIEYRIAIGGRYDQACQGSFGFLPLGKRGRAEQHRTLDQSRPARRHWYVRHPAGGPGF
jgi:hypothetical protein